MLASFARNKFRYLLGAVLIILVGLVISAYRSESVTRVSSTQERARRDTASASWYAAQERSRRDTASARWYAAQEQTVAIYTLGHSSDYWVEMTEFYTKQVNAQRVREADAIRGVAMTEFYTKKLQAGYSL